MVTIPPRRRVFFYFLVACAIIPITTNHPAKGELNHAFLVIWLSGNISFRCDPLENHQYENIVNRFLRCGRALGCGTWKQGSFCGLLLLSIVAPIAAQNVD